MNQSGLIFNEALRVCLDCFPRLRINDCFKLAESARNFGRKAVDNDWLASCNRGPDIENDKLSSEFSDLMNWIFGITKDIS